MALTQKEKYQVIFELGYPGKVLIEDSTHYDRVTARRLENLPPELEELVREVLLNLITVRSKLTASQGRALVKRVGDIELNPEEGTILSGEFRRLLAQLASLLDLHVLVRSVGGVGMVGLIL